MDLGGIGPCQEIALLFGGDDAIAVVVTKSPPQSVVHKAHL